MKLTIVSIINYYFACQRRSGSPLSMNLRSFSVREESMTTGEVRMSMPLATYSRSEGKMRRKADWSMARPCSG